MMAIADTVSTRRGKDWSYTGHPRVNVLILSMRSNVLAHVLNFDPA